MLPIRKLHSLKAKKWKYNNGKTTRIIIMLVHEKMEKSNFFFTRVCLNDHIPFEHSPSSFYRGDRIHRMP